MSNFITRSRRAFNKVLGLCALGAVTLPALAQPASYPREPISLVVPFAAGGGLDVTARILADKLKELLGQPVIIVNKPGAGSAIGAKAVASAAPDGYTLFITSGSAFGYMHLLLPSYELTLADFAPVAVVASNPSIFAVSTSLPVKSLDDLAKYAQAKPGEISFCSTGAGGLNHLQLEMFRRAVKDKTGKDFQVTHVPYNGLAPALVGIKSGSVQACTLPYTSLVKNLDGKDLRVLAVQAKARLPFLPDVPTAGESGFPTMDANEAFVNIQAPKGTPRAVLDKLQDAVARTMQDPQVRKKLLDLEVQPVYMDSEQTRKWLEEDVNRFSTVIRDAGLAISK